MGILLQTLRINDTYYTWIKCEIPSILLCKYYNKNPVMYTKNI